MPEAEDAMAPGSDDQNASVTVLNPGSRIRSNSPDTAWGASRVPGGQPLGGQPRSDRLGPEVADDPPVVLVVEDDVAIGVLLETLLRREGYRTLLARDGEAGLATIEHAEPDLVLLDVGLPRLDGFEVVRRIRTDPHRQTLPVIMLTAHSRLDDIVTGLDAGADDFLSKPFQHPELLARIRSALRLRQALVRMETAHAAVAALANAVEAKDSLTERHCQRLANMALRVGSKLGMSHGELEHVAYGALLHDVGKIGVPEAILGKTGPLDQHEWSLMREHPDIGARICAPLAGSAAFAPIVRHHHERWDGTGYPDGLRTDRIPLGARIVGLVDAFDAMTHDRPYRPARSLEASLEEVRREAGRQFDPELVPILTGQIEHDGMALDEDVPTGALLPAV
jgi:putative two-component system response regulator